MWNDRGVDAVAGKRVAAGAVIDHRNGDLVFVHHTIVQRDRIDGRCDLRNPGGNDQVVAIVGRCRIFRNITDVRTRLGEDAAVLGAGRGCKKEPRDRIRAASRRRCGNQLGKHQQVTIADRPIEHLNGEQIRTVVKQSQTVGQIEVDELNCQIVSMVVGGE